MRKYRRRYGAWLAIAVGVAACGLGAMQHARRPQPAPESELARAAAALGMPQAELEALLARETNALEPFPVRAEDGSFNTRIEASAEPATRLEQGYVSIVAPFVEEQPLQCLVYPEANDGADVVRQLASAALAAAAPEHRFQDVRGDQASGWPYLIARAYYLSDGPDGTRFGDFKIAASVRGETTVACMLDVPGYYATFEGAVRTLISTLDSARNRRLPPPQALDIRRARVPGKRVSLEQVARYDDVQGTIVARTAMELRIEPDGALSTSDDASRATYRDGQLAKGSYASVAGARMQYEVELSLSEAWYHVTGTVRGEPVTGEFRIEGGILDADRTAALSCAVRDGMQPRAELLDYLPWIDPVAATAVLVQRSDHPGADVRISAGEAPALELDVALGPDCTAERGTLRVGATALELERLLHQQHTL